MELTKFSINTETVSTGNGDYVEYQIIENVSGDIWAKTYSERCAKDILAVANVRW